MYVRLLQALKIMTASSYIWHHIIYSDTKIFVSGKTIFLQSLVIIVLLVRMLARGVESAPHPIQSPKKFY